VYNAVGQRLKDSRTAGSTIQIYCPGSNPSNDTTIPPRSRAVVRVRRLVGNTDRRQQCAWLLNVTVILLPIGIKLINLVPTVLTLGGHGRFQNPSRRGATLAHRRAVYFVLVGWWLSLLWANVASFLQSRSWGSRSQSGCSTDCRTSRRCTGFTGDPWRSLRGRRCPRRTQDQRYITSFVAATASASVSVTSIDS